MYNVYAMCTLYDVHKEYLFCAHILFISMYKYNSRAICATYRYRLYTIQNTHMLHAVCEVCSVFAIHYTLYRIHYRYIVEVKIMRRTEMIASITRSKGNFMERAMD